MFEYKKRMEKYVSGDADEKESLDVYSMFAKNEANEEFKNHISLNWNEYLEQNKHRNFELSFLLDRIHHKINIRELNKNKVLIRKVYRWYSLAAAVILIPLLIVSGIWFINNNQQPEQNKLASEKVTSTLYAPLGSRISFSLPDGTTGWLNSGSSLEYSIPFINNRKISVHGEAWLEVAHNEEHPFEVEANNSVVKVLGTKFNVSAYPEENYIEVVLAEGKVEFSQSGLTSPIIMDINDRLFSSEGKVQLEKTDAEKYMAWVDGKLVFKSDSMAEVARRIERWYNVDVELKDRELEDYVIRGTFQDDSLEEVFKFLSMTSPIRYEISDRVQLDDGTYQKQKVTVYLRK